MDKLVLTSIRLQQFTLDSAHNISKNLGFYNPSDILRLAAWIGLKIITPQNANRLMSMLWSEEAELDLHTLEDVLHTAGIIDNDTERK